MNARENPANRRGHLRVTSLAFAARHQPDEQMRVIRRSMREGLHESNFGKCRNALSNSLSNLRRFQQRGAFGEREGTDQFRLIIGGGPNSRPRRREKKSKKKRPNGNHK